VQEQQEPINKENFVQDPVSRLIPANEWGKYHPWPPIGGLRWLIFNEKRNGFHRVVRRCGRRVLIDETAFFEWTKSNDASKQ
jgi:hypothetical protein